MAAITMASSSVLAVTLTGFLILSMPARAGQQDGSAIEEIQVTATRRAVKAADVSAALTIVSAEEIAGS